MPAQDDRRDLAGIGDEQFDRVDAGLAGRPDRDTGTHEARKALKRLRALLRLARPHLGKARFRRHDGPLRDLGRALAQLRDARVAVDTLDALAPGRCPTLRARLETHYRDALAAAVDEEIGVPSLAVVVGTARTHWGGRFAAGPVPWAEGMARTRRRAASRFRRAGDRGGDGDFHEWRKEVKHLRYQAEAVTPADAALPLLVELGEVLGEEHDLTVLMALVGQEEHCGGERAPLLGLLEERRAGLRAEALALGEEAFGGADGDD